ncbi:MAG: chromosome segregation protein SMC [Alphaproteobacteria bacterium]|nr:chromosome segregation protein SMC [Alphaproteobacteria bacterium]
MQLDAFGLPQLRVKAMDGRREPRFWIRRFAIWKDVDAPAIRDEAFEPGLNIIWSPDPADRSANDTSDAPTGPGHGSGKTLVCRLIRYCLGERRFASDELRDKIASAFQDGRVGVEVVLDGTAWAVVRTIGLSPYDVALEGGTLEDALAVDTKGAPGHAALVEKLVETFITPEVTALIADKPHKAWLQALGWLARDQETHFARATAWRASGNPSVTDATNIVRALISAITPKEYELEAEIERLDKDRKAQEAGVERRRWLIEATVRKLLQRLDLDGQAVPIGEFQGAFLRKAARDRVAAVAAVDDRGDLASVEDLEVAYEEARADVDRLNREIAAAENNAALAATIIELIQSESPGLSAEIDDAETSICPVCEVPIDRALAEGCKLSHKLPNLDTLKGRREQNAASMQKHREEQRDAEEVAQRLRAELSVATRKRDAAKADFRSARKLREQRADAWYSARRVGDDVGDLERLVQENAAATSKVSRLEEQLDELRAAAKVERDQHAQVFAELGKHFDPLVRRLLGRVSSASGRVKHDGNGLDLVVDYGGERNTPAIDLVKVLAFDLATLCRSIEGATRLPALLIHDSPRTSDLGLSIYHELFLLTRELEDVGDGPHFQYIVTTTSRPPDDLVDDPRLRMKLMGAPAEARLLGRDL